MIALSSLLVAFVHIALFVWGTAAKDASNEGSSNSRGVINLENFDWKAYVQNNKDLASQGITTEAAAVSHYINIGHKEGRRYNKVMPEMETFDWRSYLFLNPELHRSGISTEDQAWQHYRTIGIREGRLNHAPAPVNASLEAAVSKLQTFLDLRSKLEGVTLDKTNFFIYHVEDIETSLNSAAVIYNNVKLFASAVRQNQLSAEAAQNAFYWINAASISPSSPLAELFPGSHPNVAVVRWEIDGGVMYTHLNILERLKASIMSNFGAVFFSNSGVRGPFDKRGSGAWMVPFRALMQMNKIGIVGATATCSPTPHVQTHFFGVKSSLIPHMLVSAVDGYRQAKIWVSLDSFFETELARITTSLGYDAASMMHYTRHQNARFRDACSNVTTATASTSQGSLRERCYVAPHEANFVRWGGEGLGAEGYLCNKALATDLEAVNDMQSVMAAIAAAEPHVQLEELEVPTGGLLRDLYQSYAEEFRAPPDTNATQRRALAADLLAELASPALGDKAKVCFLVRASKGHDPAVVSNPKAKYGMIALDLDGHVRALRRQTNPHWKAFFFLGEKPAFARRLQQLLSAYSDPRLEFAGGGKSALPTLGRGGRPQAVSDDVIATATLRQALTTALEDPECRWFSLTTAGTAYGSAVVQNVLHPSIASAASVDLLLAPMDSKYFARADYEKRGESRWDQRCLGLEATLHHNLLAYTAQPLPLPGRVDLSAAFLSRERVAKERFDFVSTTVLSANESYVVDPLCSDAFCLDGRVLHHLVHVRQWSYLRLPLGGLPSVVYQENSPTLCAASGNVWFDYPMVTSVGCISHKTLYVMSQKDSPRSAFDWPSFHAGDRLCLRLSNHGFNSRTNAARKAEVVAKASKGKQRRALLAAPTPTDTDGEGMHVARALEDSGAKLPEDFDWRQYLIQNPDLQAEGIVYRPAAREHYLSVGQQQGRAYQPVLPEFQQFDWFSYLEFNRDLQATLRTEAEALAHFKAFGRAQNRPFRKGSADKASWAIGMQKLDAYLLSLIANAVDMRRRNMLVYHVEDCAATGSSFEVVRNNLRIFIAAITHHSSGDQEVFYWINVVGAHNPLLAEVPAEQKNVAVVVWDVSPSDMHTHVATVSALNREMQWSFSAVFFCSTGVRGPLMHAQQGEWMREFRNMLEVRDVGIVGSTISCRGGPHVQTHFFGLRSALVPVFVREIQRYYKLPSWRNMVDHFDVELSAAVIRAGYRITSKLTQKRLDRPFFSHNCTSEGEFGIPTLLNWDYETWCELEFHDVVFVRWGGEPLGHANAGRYLCDKALGMSEAAIAKMDDTMMDVSGGFKPGTFTLPETPVGGGLYDLFKQYREEMWHDRGVSAEHAPVNKAGDDSGSASQVCFLVRTSINHDPAGTVRASPELEEMDISTLVQSLLRQTNPNWRAYFFITDTVPFESRLRKILRGVNDKRVSYLPVDYAHRPAFTKEDAGYTAVDYVLREMATRRECRYLTITNGDNVYGSEVVASVLRHGGSAVSRGTSPPPMLLAPLDGRSLAEQDYYKRQESELSDRCKGIHAMLEQNLLAYTAQPVPYLGRVDLAVVFFDRERLMAENLRFGNFTKRKGQTCVGCQDGLLTQYLVRNRRWDYTRLPLDGLRSVVFHGPSPTWCIAAGNVWFDYPHVHKVGCFTHETVNYLRRTENAAAPMYDWAHYEEVGRKCLRLSKTGFSSKAVGG